MSSEENKAVLRRINDDVVSQGKFAVVDELLTPDFIDHTPFPGVPATREGITLLFKGLRSAFPDLTATIRDQVAEGDRVVTRKLLHGTHGGELFGIPATGRHVDFGVIDIVRVVDGTMAEHWAVVDQMTLMQQLGVIPQQEPAEAGQPA